MIQKKKRDSEEGRQKWNNEGGIKERTNKQEARKTIEER
jgi:hypothetical protein